MIKALLSVRFQGLFAGATSRGKKNQAKKRSVGMVILFVVLYIYLFAVVAGMMAFAFSSLVDPYHALGLDWLYFSIAGMMALGIALIGSVFITQNQLYDAKDNELLLSMPVTPGAILLSRMIPLLVLNLLFAGMVMIPAIVVYAVKIQVGLGTILLPLLSLIGICFFAQAIACLLGWLLHLVLSRMNKSFASMLYMVVFLGLYFWFYSQAGDILQSIAVSGQKIAGIVQSWVWPMYAMGVGSTGQPLLIAAFLGICAVLFGIIYWFLSATFLKTATASKYSRKRKRLNTAETKCRSAASAVAAKDFRKFLTCPVYLTNMGLGILMIAAFLVAALILRNDLLPIFQLPGIRELTPVILCAILAFSISTCCISTPSVSLEGKNIWILKCLPVSSKQILLSKLSVHIWLTVPLSCITGLILSIAYGCGIADVILTALIPGLLALMSGLLGMWAGLQWAKLDYISEAYPCKQSWSVVVAMFGMMGVPVVLGLGYYLVFAYISPTLFLLLSALILAAGCYGLYRVLVTWGVKKWESL